MAKATTTKSASAPKTSKASDKTPTKIGMVDSDKRSKSRRVVVEILSTHPKYQKILRSRTVLHVHDEKNQSHFGDVVEVRPCPPKSKTKRWELVRIIQKGVGMRFEGVEVPGAAKKA
jgi:small subunit ribosomal protein S17